MKKILIALDYDPTAQKVAEAGYSLCNGIQNEITLLHVVENPSYYASTVYDPIMGFGGYMDIDLLGIEAVDKIKSESAAFLNKAKEHLGNNNIKILVMEGKAGEIITSTAVSLQADMIIMGSHSRRWLERILLGSVTQHVLNNTAIPLLIITTKKNSSPTIEN